MARRAILNMSFDLPAGRFIQLLIDILGKFSEQIKAVRVMLVGGGHAQNNSLIFPEGKAGPDGAGLLHWPG